MRKKEKQRNWQTARRNLRADAVLLLQVVAVYYGVLALLIFLTLFCRIPLYGGVFHVQPRPWLFLIEAWYYLVPVVLAAVYGFFFRPFWIKFRNFIAAVFFIHIAASFGLNIWHWQYLNTQRTRMYEVRMAPWRVAKVGHHFLDRNRDGMVDQVRFDGRLNVNGLPPGQYDLTAMLSQNGTPLPGGRFGVLSFEHSAKETTRRFSFGVDPQRFNRYFSNGSLDLDLLLQNRFVPGREGRRVVTACRWAPFFRTSTWDGRDPDIQGRFITVGVKRGVDAFRLLPVRGAGSGPGKKR